MIIIFKFGQFCFIKLTARFCSDQLIKLFLNLRPLFQIFKFSYIVFKFSRINHRWVFVQFKLAAYNKICVEKYRDVRKLFVFFFFIKLIGFFIFCMNCVLHKMENLLASNSLNSYPNSFNSSPNPCNSRAEQENADDNNTFVWEKLESACIVIRELEIQLDRTVDDVNELQIDWNEKLKFFENTLGNAIEKSRPFYECIDHWRPYYETKEQV